MSYHATLLDFLFFMHTEFSLKIFYLLIKKGSVIKNTIGEKRDTNVKIIISVSN